ncbi:MAG: imidazolonepropionase [Candidatus Neomarinimicrobiota bacterium]
MLKFTNIGEMTTFDSTAGNLISRSGVEILVKNGLIHSIGTNLGAAGETIDCGGKLVTPGFVDPHTHPVFVAGRQAEFAQRIAGASYGEIAAAGGGIRSSVTGIRSAGEDELTEIVSRRLDRFLSLGTTTIEAKSGYGLSTAAELKSLVVLGRLASEHPIDIVPTFMGAHAFPTEYADNHEAYVDLICREMLPAVAGQGIARFCDIFCETGYFSVDQARRILTAARHYDLIPRLHADEFQDSGAAELAAEIGAVSADHLMAVSAAGMAAMAQADVIATLLPGTTFFLGQNSYAPARRLLDQGVKVALATDFNPGSCHIQSMPFIISLACLYLHMTVEEAFVAATYRAAEALLIQERVGSLEPGKQADLIIWDLENILEIPYYVTDLPIIGVVKNGLPIFGLD